ncbi:MAG: hypothetical protein OHK0029_13870 [Armatimonadaceae bacterium]
MWHRFTPELQETVRQALCAADNDSRKDISTRHLLMGLCHVRTGRATQILDRLHARPFEGSAPTEPGTDSGERSLTPAARKAVHRAYAEAVAWGEQSIGGEHLLFGLLRTSESEASALLDQAGVTLQTATEALFALEPDRYIVPEGVRLPETGARTVAKWRHQATQKANLAKRAAGAFQMLPQEPILITFLARPIRIRYPHWFFRRLRARGLYFSSLAGGWIVSDYENATRVLKDPAFSAARYDWQLISGSPLHPLIDREFNPLFGYLSRQMLFLDAPEQTRLRSLVSRQFTPRVLEAMRTQIQEVTDNLLDRVRSARQMDVVEDFAFPLPATVIARLLGVPDGDLNEFRAWSDDFVRFIGGQSSLAEELRAYYSLTKLGTFFRQAIERARHSPKNDTLISLFVHAQDAEGTRLTDEEIITNAMLLLAAGHETTTHLIGNGLRLLLQFPDARRELQANPEKWNAAVEEMLRFEPPVQWTSRIARAATSVAGTPIGVGEWVNVALAAANRDPARFPDADRFDIDRPDNKHLSFGSGPHYCLGAALARMEGAIALATLLRRFPNIRLADRTPHWRNDFTFRAQTKMPVSLR